LINRKFTTIILSVLTLIASYPIFGIKVSLSLFAILLSVTPLKTRFLEDTLLWLLVTSSFIEGISLLYWILIPSDNASMLKWFSDFEFSLYGVAALLAPQITILALFIWAFKPAIESRIESFMKQRSSKTKLSAEGDEVHLKPDSLLMLSIIIAVFGALYPYIPSVNQASGSFGSDVKSYVKTMELIGDDLSSAFNVSGGSRPLIYLAIYAFQTIFRLDTLEAVKLMPLLLNPMLCASVYFMVSRASGDREWAGLASLFTSLGFNITVGMYAYYLTNILGLILVFLATGFLFDDMANKKSIPLAASIMASLAIFTHPWTFAQFYVSLGALGAFFGYKWIKGDRSEPLYTMLVFLLVTGLVDVLKGRLLGGFGGVGSVASTFPTQFNFPFFWESNKYTFRALYGGLLSNSLMILLSGAGIYLLKNKKPYELFLKILVILSSIYYLFSHGMFGVGGYNYNPSRVLYNVPFGVFAAMSLMTLIRTNSLKKRTRITAILSVTLSMAVYLFRSLANLI
jgi:hypothetical protein